MPNQVSMTILADVHAADVVALKTALDSINTDGRRRKLLPFEDLPVHFARFVVLDEAIDPDGHAYPPRLVFLSDIDSPTRGYLDDLVDRAAEGLDQIFRHCVGYPASPTGHQRRQFLNQHIIKTTTAYVNTVGRSLEQIRSEAALREAVEDFLDGKNWTDKSPSDVRAAVQEFVSGQAGLQWARRPAERPSLRWRVTNAAHLAVGAAAVLVLSPLLLVLLPIWLVALRVHEHRDVPSTPPPDPAHARQLAEAEGFLAQNQLSAVGFVKPGWFRRITLAGVLWLLDYSARHVYNKGNLAGIRTIHFARWVFLDDKRRLIFASNYDGSLESYMDDFIDKVAWGLNAAFSNGRGYPKTRWLLFGGAKDEPAFKNYLRNHQIPTQIWYSAYDDLTADNIANNAAVRAGLHGTMTDQEVEAWVKRL
jgi:hypothetical protein